MRLFHILLIVAWATSNSAYAQKMARANSIMVIVNDVVITEDDVKESLLPSIESLYNQYASKPAELEKRLIALQRERLEELVAHQLILNDYTNTGYKLPENIIEDQIQARIKEEYGDRPALIKTLKARGVTYESYRQNIRDAIVVRALRDKNVSQNIIISPNRIEEYYQTNLNLFQRPDQVKVRTIVFNKPKDSPETTRRLAEEVLKKLDEGAAFAEMAGVYSDGPQRGQGGSLGWVEASALRKELADAAFSLKPGQRSSIVEIPEAYFIVLVEETKSAHVKPLSEVREGIERLLIIKEQDRLYNQYLDRLKKKAFIRYF
jgi:peptidyl-prolyl cis-trans isomerase SurA